MTTEEAVLQRWIGAVDQLAPQQRPDAERLRAVAIELGLPDDVIELAQARADELRSEALRLQEKGRHTEARQALERAVELVPWSLEVREELAGLTGPPKARLPWPLAALGLLGIVGGAMWVARPSGGRSAVASGERPAIPVPAAGEVAGGPLPPGPTELDLPTRVVGELPEGASIEAQPFYTAYLAQGSWNVKSPLVLTAGAEGIAHASFQASLIDADGVIASTKAELVGSSDPAIFDGERAVEDLLILSSLHRVPEALMLTVERVQTAPGRGLYGEEHVIAGLPEGIELKLHERRSACRVSFQSRVACQGVFVVENVGQVAVDRLKLKARFGSSGITDETWAVASGDAPLAPGDRQPMLFIEIFDGPVPEGRWSFEASALSTP